jgi:hypothetical protein
MGLTLAAIGLGVQALSGVGSFIQAGQRQKEINKANAAAQKAVAEAKKQIQVKPYEALTVSDIPYEQQREKIASMTAQQMEGYKELGVQGMRGAGALAMASTEAQAKVQAEKTKALEGIDLLKAGDELREAKELGQLAKDEAEGAQQAAADAQAAKAASITSGMGSLTDASKIFTTIDPETGMSVAESLGLGGGLYGRGEKGIKV